MCGGFKRRSTTELSLINKMYGAMNPQWEIELNDMVKPQATSPIIAKDEWTLSRWGFKPYWSQDVSKAFINARSETLDTKMTFKGAFESQRCIIPAAGFYEGGQLFSNTSGLLMAGVFSLAHGGSSYAIITKDSNELVAKHHHRMPVLLSEDAAKAWMDSSTSKSDLKDIMRMDNVQLAI